VAKRLLPDPEPEPEPELEPLEPPPAPAPEPTSGAARPKAYGYVRVSTGRQAVSGLSLEAQKERIEGYFKYALAATHEWGGFYEDAAVSGVMPIRQRPAGARLNVDMKPGDVVVIAKLDRGFRSMRDLILTMDAWTKREVYMNLLDLNIDTSTPVGRMLVGILGHVAQFERERISERVHEAKAKKRERSRRRGSKTPNTCGIAPYGFFWHKHNWTENGERILVRDPGERKWGARCLDLYRRGWATEKIYFLINKERKRHRWRRSNKKEWSLSRVTEVIIIEAHYQAQEWAGNEARYDPGWVRKGLRSVRNLPLPPLSEEQKGTRE
jgi:putative DNA-invertase from lambdoid prophage Rac